MNFFNISTFNLNEGGRGGGGGVVKFYLRPAKSILRCVSTTFPLSLTIDTPSSKVPPKIAFFS